MMILMFDRKATDPAVPTWAMPGQRVGEPGLALHPGRTGEVNQGQASALAARA